MQILLKGVLFMTNYREILRQDHLGIAKQDIAISCGCSRNTVRNVLNLAKNLSLTWEAIQGCSNERLKSLLFERSENRPAYKMPDYQLIHREMQKSGVTLTLLWVEYCEQCRRSGELPYKSTQFNKYYADYVHKTKATMHLIHKPGETLQVDWAGQTVAILDRDTAQNSKAYIFVAALPCSGYSYVEAYSDQKQNTWINAHINTYNFFGGATRILTSDNLKTGIIKNTRTETIINRAYQEMAEHYNTAIIPTRVKMPKDKAFVESAVGNVSTWILAALRNQQFFSIRELNEAILEKLYEFNHRPFQKREGSRASVFEEERPFLLPLPKTPFELAEWKVATVQYNYHVSIEHMNYSCPYEYIRQKVNVRITHSAVEIFFEGTRIASHPRLFGRPNQYSTLEIHMPQAHQKYVQWNGDRFIKWAKQIGENTQAVIDLFLSAYKVEQQGYKSCMALLKLTDKYPPNRIEAACAKALSFSPSPSLKSIQSILKSGVDKIIDPQPETTRKTSLYSFTRGADYYRRDK